MTATTIKIDSSVRDRLNELAAAQGRTAGSMVEKLLDDYLWQQKVEAAVSQMSSMSAEERGEYLAEVQLWDSTAGDGLKEWWENCGRGESSGPSLEPPSDASSRGLDPHWSCLLVLILLVLARSFVSCPARVGKDIGSTTSS